MARIRSVHPGLASDEAFMSMSMAAKAGWSLLWTECDDAGVFEWKPIVLKARIFPADNVDFAALLAEYAALGCIKRVEFEGRSYGLVRNFRKYQRPKHPSLRHPKGVADPEYVGLPDTDGVKPPPEGGEGGVKPTENPPQMKEGVGEERAEANASGAAAPHLTVVPANDVDPSEPERDLFKRGREIFGDKAGSVVASLLKSRGNNVALARAVLEEASQKDGKMAWLQAAIKRGGRGPPSRSGNPYGSLALDHDDQLRSFRNDRSDQTAQYEIIPPSHRLA